MGKSDVTGWFIDGSAEGTFQPVQASTHGFVAKTSLSKPPVADVPPDAPECPSLQPKSRHMTER